jgi:hypothetical protein
MDGNKTPSKGELGHGSSVHRSECCKGKVGAVLRWLPWLWCRLLEAAHRPWKKFRGTVVVRREEVEGALETPEPLVWTSLKNQVPGGATLGCREQWEPTLGLLS